ncbi:PD-(D/E)XK nuclease family protein [Bradyrhizobium sp. 139]|uniref:PD-(D/E)XK nuclease family protein n=1 Tax=Bradyrhizobium sp. 139 TaxID=2782616 RepID=UPI001FF7ACB5|nr:PD-(D/E)XK nuclease family protein [Bradyrhizobium sp. 139]MCK1741376.1 PD-(D/E)XK nuclease family protein [Bradyrhizobium sp. 139]
MNAYVKPFAWSYSRLKNYESCPKRHWHVDINKDVKEEQGEALLWGNEVHKRLADRIGKGTPLAAGTEKFEKWVQKVSAGQGNPGVQVLVEQQLAIDANFAPTAWFESEARRAGKGLPWYRGIGDVLKIVGPVALIVDWKTGKVLEDSQQLALMASCVFAHYPEVLKVRSLFVWLKDDCETKEDYHRNDMPAMWKHLWPRIEALKHAHENTLYPPKAGALCRRYCPVAACPHYGSSNW